MSGVRVLIRMTNQDTYRIRSMSDANALELTEDLDHGDDVRPLVLVMDSRLGRPPRVVHLVRSAVSSVEFW